jgi:hypothetical protein
VREREREVASEREKERKAEFREKVESEDKGRLCRAGHVG